MHWMTRLPLGMLMRVVLGIPCVGATPPPLAQIGASCDLPTYASDVLVCGDPELLALDRKMRSALAASELKTSVAPQALFESQDAWFRRRSLCAFSERHAICLKAAYAERIGVLDALRVATSIEPRVVVTATCRGGPWGSGTVRILTLDKGPLLIEDAESKVLVAATKAQSLEDWSPFVRFTFEGNTIRLKALGRSTITCTPTSPISPTR
jgi:uncharacterized protein